MLLLAIIAEVLISYFLPLPIQPSAIWQWIGVGLIILGMLPALIINVAFKRAETSIIPDATPHALLETGLFAYSRNPIYIGMFVMLIGVALLSGNLLALSVPPIFIIAVHYLWVRKEEANLETQFGDAYRAYCARVRRWL